MTTINLLAIKATRKRTDQREWIDSFEVASEDVLTEFDPDTHGPSDGAALIAPDAFDKDWTIEDLKAKIQSAINGATQADKSRKYRILSYGENGLIVIRTA